MIRKNSIITKIIVTCSLIVVLSLILSDIVAYDYIYNILKQQYIDDGKTQLTTTSRQFEYISNDIKKVAVNEALDSDIQKFLRNPISNDSYIKYSNVQKISKKLSAFAIQRDYLQNIVILKDDKRLNDDDIVMSLPQTDYGVDAPSYLLGLKASWYTQMPKNQRDFFSSKFNLKLSHSNVDLLPYILNVTDVNNPDKVVGRVILNIRYDYLKDIFVSYSKGNDYNYWLNSSYETLYQKAPDSPGITVQSIAAYAKTAADGKTTIYNDSFGYVFIDKSMNNGWVFISVMSYASISQKLQKIIYFFLIYTIVILVLIFAVFLPIILGITRPLSRLTKAMRQVSKGNMDVSISVKNNDEIGDLTLCFNNMLLDIKENIRKSAEYEKTEKQMQLNLLLAQINPHFIYNTLQTIVYMAKKIEADNIVNMTTAFIGVLQDIVRISDGGLVTTLEQEVEVLRQYLTIQQYRYKDRFQVSWEIDEGMMSLYVPRSILQPIVENSLYHGILTTSEIGMIDIAIKDLEQTLCITVFDNGTGIDPETIPKLMDPAQENHKGEMRSIGLKNVNDRIQYICGNDFGLTIESKLGKYTKIIFTLPKSM